MNRRPVPSPCSHPDSPIRPRDRRKTPPVRRRREATGKYLIYIALSSCQGANLSAKSMIRPVCPLLQGSGRLRAASCSSARGRLRRCRRTGGAHDGIVLGDPRRVAAGRNIDLDRHFVAARSAQHVSVGRLADPSGYAADGRPGVHDALYPGARGQDRDRTRPGAAARWRSVRWVTCSSSTPGAIRGRPRPAISIAAA